MGSAAHRLVAIGDSLTQGFMGGAIHRTDVSYPALLAQALGVAASFDVPSFTGFGGLPINLERLIGALSAHYGEEIKPWNVPGMLLWSHALLDDTETYWERGPGAGPQEAPARHHNLAVWGFEVDDARTLTDAVCVATIDPPSDNFLGQLPNDPMYRTARRVLNPRLDPALAATAPLDAAGTLADDGGIENLVVFLGANNCLGTVTSLDIDYVAEADLDKPRPRRLGNLYAPAHFAYHYDQVADRVDALGAERVFVGTVPHVTIPPVVRGVSPGGTLREGLSAERKYFEYYTRPWVWDTDFDPDAHPHLTREQAIEIDMQIDAYNQVVRETAGARGWHLVDISKVLDDLAYRSHEGHPPYRFPPEAIAALERNARTSYLVHEHHGERRVTLDTRFFHLQSTERALPLDYLVDEGGIFSLDGIHPTTIGYGIVAHEFRDAMVKAGVPDLAPLDWDRIVREDSLVTRPPAMMTNLRKTMRRMDKNGWLSKLLREF